MMKKGILSIAVLFALSLSMGAVAQDKKTTDNKKEKTECCQNKEKSDKTCCQDKADKKTDKKEKSCCQDKSKDAKSSTEKK